MSCKYKTKIPRSVVRSVAAATGMSYRAARNMVDDILKKKGRIAIAATVLHGTDTMHLPYDHIDESDEYVIGYPNRESRETIVNGTDIAPETIPVDKGFYFNTFSGDGAGVGVIVNEKTGEVIRFDVDGKFNIKNPRVVGKEEMVVGEKSFRAFDLATYAEKGEGNGQPLSQENIRLLTEAQVSLAYTKRHKLSKKVGGNILEQGRRRVRRRLIEEFGSVAEANAFRKYGQLKIDVGMSSPFANWTPEQFAELTKQLQTPPQFSPPPAILQ